LLCSIMGNSFSVIGQMFPGHPKSWNASHIPDLTGRVALVTGGNTGTGKETVKALLEKNAKVYLAARSQDRAEAAIKELKESTGKEAIWLQLDLADLASVRKAANSFLSQESDLHLLFNNAGVMWTPPDMLTKDGYDLQWGTNVVGHWLLTKQLLPALERGATSSPDKRSHVVFTSSSAVYLDPKIYWDTFIPGPARSKKSPIDLYNQSKAGDVVAAREYAKRFADKNIIFSSVNPGNIKTELTRYTTPMQLWMISKIQYPAAYGALPQLYAATGPQRLDANGKFFVPWSKEASVPAAVKDPKVGEELWEWLERDTATKGI